MLERSQIKRALDDWTEWQTASGKSAVKRSISIRWPANHALALIGVRRSGKAYVSLEVAKARYSHLLYFNFEDPIAVLFNDVRIFDEIISVFTEYSGHHPM